MAQVIRAFSDPDVVHVEGQVSPKDDIETINTELILADLQTVDKALPRLEKEARLQKDRAPVLEAVRVHGPSWTPAARSSPRASSWPLRELTLLTAKPFLYVFNVDEAELADAAYLDSLRALVAPAEAVFLDAKIESELIDLPAADAAELLESIGQSEPGLDQLVRVGFGTLGLQTYLTAGPKESAPGRSRSARGAVRLRPARRRPDVRRGHRAGDDRRLRHDHGLRPGHRPGRRHGPGGEGVGQREPPHHRRHLRDHGADRQAAVADRRRLRGDPADLLAGPDHHADPDRLRLPRPGQLRRGLRRGRSRPRPGSRSGSTPW